MNETKEKDGNQTKNTEEMEVAKERMEEILKRIAPYVKPVKTAHFSTVGKWMTGHYLSRNNSG